MDTGTQPHNAHDFSDVDRVLIDETLHFVVERAWRVTDSEFFDELVTYLGTTLGVAYVFCDEIDSSAETTVRTRALYSHGKITTNIRYGLKGTPCENVIGQRLCCYPSKVQQQFPDDQLLCELSAESYAGIPLWTADGSPLGLIAVMDDKPLQSAELVKTLLQIVAVRAGAELERLQVLERLKNSQQRFMDFAEISSDWFWEMDANLRFSYFSDRFEAVSGVPPNELLGKTREETGIPDADPDAWATHLANLQAHRAFVDFEHPRTSAEGKKIWLLIAGKPVFDDDGVFQGYRGTGTDITKRKRAEQALVENQRTLTTLLSNLPGMAYRVRCADEYIIDFVSEGCFKLTGYRPEQVIGSHGGFRKCIDRPNDHGLMASKTGQRKYDCEPFQITYQIFTADGETKWVWEQGCGVYGTEGELLSVEGFITDVTESRRLQEELTYQAISDALTGLHNRREFELQLARVLETARDSGTEHALCYLDLDQFKIINDTCGHMAGDELLRQVGHLLSASVRKRDTLARLGGDEFGILMEHCTLAQALRVANKVRSSVAGFRFVWEERVFRIGVSIGLVPITASSESVTSLLSAADSACYVAKDEGRNRVHVYHIDDTKLVYRRGEMQWVGRINQALEDQRLQLWAQPIAPVMRPAGKSERFELLLRLVDEDGEIIPAGVFLPAAERYGLSTKLDRWVVAATFNWLSANPQRLKRTHMCFINLSGTSLADDEFLAFMNAQLEQSQVPAQKICFEITETAAIANLSKAMIFMGSLKAHGCRFALDDFGSGLSSFAYLKTLPVDYLKIDGAFVKDIVDDDVDLALVRSINDVGKVMGKRTIAEFVENKAILAKLKEIGVDYAQGYGIGRPVPIEGDA